MLATQPVFPEIAIRRRLSWAGLEHIPFELITHIENMFACKPHREYFDQILQLLNVKSESCLMIGNDAKMDMAAKLSGIETFFLKTEPGDSQIKIKNADYLGNFEKLGSILGLKLLS